MHWARRQTKQKAAAMASISFLCPLYNKSRYLPGVLAALQKQAPAHDRQFIFVDDGSSDDSLEMAKSLTRRWANCLYLRQDNMGPSGSTNTGISHATGDYLKLLGCDDILAPDATDRLLNALDATGAVAAYSRQAYYRTMDDIVFADGGGQVLQIDDPLRSVICQTISGTSQTLFRTAAVRAVGGCDPRIFAEDYSLALRLACIGPFVILDRVTAYGPADDGERIMVGRKHQLFHDYNLALALFFADHPERRQDHGRLALRRAAGRAEKWVRREGDGQSSLRYRMMWLASWLPGLDHAALIPSTLAAFAAGPQARAKGILRPKAANAYAEMRAAPAAGDDRAQLVG
jgi:hypothetical protein